MWNRTASGQMFLEECDQH